jgi:hypothetical protein
MNPVSLNWQKSSYSSNGDGNACVEVAAAPEGHRIHLRESEDATVILTTTPATLGTFIRAIKSGEFQQPS